MMKTSAILSTSMSCIGLLFFGLVLQGCESHEQTQEQNPNPEHTAQKALDSTEHTSSPDAPEATWRADGKHRFVSTHHDHGMRAIAQPGRLTLRTSSTRTPSAFALTWTGVLADDVALELPPVYDATVEEQTVTFHRGALEEWYSNHKAIEHGFTIERPLSENTRVLVFEFELEEGQIASDGPDAFQITTSRGDQLRYRNLKVTDANDRLLEAEIVADGSARFTLRTDVEDAEYPILIDPTFQGSTSTHYEPGSGGGPFTGNVFGNELLFANDWLFVTASGNLTVAYGAIYAYEIPSGFSFFTPPPAFVNHTAPTGGAQELSYKLDWSAPLLFAVAPDDNLGFLQPSAGAIITYHYDGTDWIQHQNIFENPRAENNRFGWDFSVGLTHLAAINNGWLGGADQMTIFRSDGATPPNYNEVATLTADFGRFEAVAAAAGDFIAASVYDSGGPAFDLAIYRDTGGDTWTPMTVTDGGVQGFASRGLLEFSDNGDLLVAARSVTDPAGHPDGIFFYDRVGVNTWDLTKRVQEAELLPDSAPFPGAGSLHVISNDRVLVTNPGPQDVLLFERNEGGADNWGVSRVYEIPASGGLVTSGVAWDVARGDLFAGARGDGTYGAGAGAFHYFRDCTGAEVCDGLDNDCDGIVDEAPATASSCAAGETCSFGVCFDECTTTVDCMGTEICYADSMRCDDPDDPCTSITCPFGDVCVGGSCFTECTSAAMCDPLNEACYQSGRCARDDDPCDGIECPVDQICVGGGCFDPCAADDECTPPLLCWAGTYCAEDPCDDIDCPVGQICVGGSCFDPCAVDADCTPPSVCWDGTYCAEDPCDGVACSGDQVCVGGECFDPCADSGDCTPPLVCWDDTYCAVDACDGFACSEGQICVSGGCFDPCAGDADCTPPQKCWKSTYCSVDACDGIACESGETCVDGTCFLKCTEDDECDPDSMCYRGACVVEDCAMVSCEAGSSCHRGVCFEDCTGDVDCDDPGHRCWESRCAPDPCEALAPSVIAAYEATSVVKKHDRAVLAYQDSTPLIYPRPVQGTDFSGFADVTGGVSSAPVHASNRARVVLYYDESIAGGSYIVWLTHGNGSGQPPAELAYTVRGTGDTEGDVVFVDDTATHQKATDGNNWFIQSMISTASNETGGIALGEFPADEAWSIRIAGAFSDAITGWEFWDAETNSVTRLHTNETLVIRSTDWPSTRPFTPTTGQACEVEGQLGICKRGSLLECKGGEITCEQTVFPNAEVCDGLDNNCDGETDEFDDDLVVPQVSIRQDGVFGWRNFMTYDQIHSIDQTMDYDAVAGSDKTLGSSRPETRAGTPMQTSRFTATLFAHRNLATGDLDVAWIAGDTALTADTSDYPLIWDIRAFHWTTFDDFGISWFEDRDRSLGEYVVDNLNNAGREFKIRHKLERRAGRSETESDALRMLWNADEIHTRIELSSNSAGSSDNFDLAYYEPGSGKTNLVDHQAVRVRVQGVPIDDSVCAASSMTTMGCDLSRYQCVAGSLRCGAADDSVCNVGCIDNDGDGYGAPGSAPGACMHSEIDCDDDDPSVYPGASELCNGIDNDCDGVPDSTTIGCPAGMTTCGPAECNFALACMCPDGPEYSLDPPDEPCLCGNTLAP